MRPDFPLTRAHDFLFRGVPMRIHFRMCFEPTPPFVQGDVFCGQGQKHFLRPPDAAAGVVRDIFFYQETKLEKPYKSIS